MVVRAELGVAPAVGMDGCIQDAATGAWRAYLASAHGAPRANPARANPADTRRHCIEQPRLKCGAVQLLRQQPLQPGLLGAFHEGEIIADELAPRICCALWLSAKTNPARGARMISWIPSEIWLRRPDHTRRWLDVGRSRQDMMSRGRCRGSEAPRWNHRHSFPWSSVWNADLHRSGAGLLSPTTPESACE